MRIRQIADVFCYSRMPRIPWRVPVVQNGGIPAAGCGKEIRHARLAKLGQIACDDRIEIGHQDRMLWRWRAVGAVGDGEQVDLDMRWGRVGHLMADMGAFIGIFALVQRWVHARRFEYETIYLAAVIWDHIQKRHLAQCRVSPDPAPPL